MLPIIKGYVTYKDVFIHRLYGIEDFDLFWQMINYKLLIDAWSSLEAEQQK